MNGRALIRQFAVLIVLFGAFNVALHFARRNSPPRALVRKLWQTPAPDALVVGNSLVVAAVDEEAIRRGGEPNGVRQPVMLGIGYSRPPEHQVLFAEALKKQDRYRALVYVFFDFHLTDDDIKISPNDNSVLCYYLNPALGARYYAKTPVERLEFATYPYLPFIIERSAVWERVEVLRRKLGGIGMPPVVENKFGRAADFAALEAADSATFDRTARETVAKGKDLILPIRDLVEAGKKHCDRVLFVEMCMPSRHRQLFYETAGWRQYREYVRAKLESQGVEYVNASDWITDDAKFVDNVHLGKDGAREFSERLGRLLAGR
jgi:hypothetical protein